MFGSISPFGLFILVIIIALTSFPMYRISYRAGFRGAPLWIFTILAPFLSPFLYIILALIGWPIDKEKGQ